MTVENISWSISTKECCRPWRGSNLRPPGLQSDVHPTAPPRLTRLKCWNFQRALKFWKKKKEIRFFSKVNWFIYLSSPISTLSFNTRAQIVFWDILLTIFHCNILQTGITKNVACGRDGVMLWDMSIKGDHFVWLLQQKLKSRKFVKYKQGMKTIWSTSRERRPAELVSCQFLALTAILFSLVEPV